MKGEIQPGRQRRRNATRTEWALGVVIICLLLKLYYPGITGFPNHTEDDQKIFICHSPQPNLLNRHDIDRSAFESDIKWATDLLDGFAKGNIGYGQAADSVTLSIFLPNGPPIFERGFGKVKANESKSSAPDGDSIYRMASITKMFTTAQLMLQKQRGQLDLDQDVSSILDDFNPSVKGWTGIEEKRAITTRQLLSHTSGLLRDDPLDIPWPHMPDQTNKSLILRSATRTEIMAKVRDTPAVMAQSTVPIYSNVGFDVAGYVAEEIGKTPYAELLEQDIFKPLKMSSASFKRQYDKLDRVVVPSEPFSIVADHELGDEDPSGGMYCSAADLRRFGQELLTSGACADIESQNSGNIFDKITTREWLRPIHVFDDGFMSLGLPWEIFTLPVGNRRMSFYTKGGTLQAMHTLFGIDPEREFGFAFLISGEPIRHVDLAMQIMPRFAKTLDAQRQSIINREFAGTYVKDDKNLIKLELVDGGLAMTRALIDGENIFETLHLGQGEGDYVALWPTGEPNVWRLAIGRPPAQPYYGCMLKFASIDPAVSRGFPVDLLIIENGKLFYGALNHTYHRV